ncbi:hypothetical protein KBB41_03390 [Candidatus Curtissbacteria bacterium]|nr:hypothetical protein [Candidatus Curtissbacteria bacterium]
MDRLLLLGNINSLEVWAFFDTIEELTVFALEQEINVVYILKNHIEVDIPESLKKDTKNGGQLSMDNILTIPNISVKMLSMLSCPMFLACD